MNKNEFLRSIKNLKWGIKLTDANCRQQSDRFIWRVALWEERFGGVDREGQSHDGLSARSDDDTLNPQPDKGHERAEGDHDVSVVRSRFPDHAAQLSVAVSSDHAIQLGKARVIFMHPEIYEYSPPMEGLFYSVNI